jgi:hypothetical protein
MRGETYLDTSQHLLVSQMQQHTGRHSYVISDNWCGRIGPVDGLQVEQTQRHLCVYKFMKTIEYIQRSQITDIPTELRGRVVNIHASYSAGSGSESLSRRPTMLIEGFRGLPRSLQVNAG